MSSVPSRPSMSGDLRLLAGAVFLSAAGDLLALIVLALQVHELTGSGLAVSALFATALAPMMALAPLAGLVAVGAGGVLVSALGPRAALLLAGLGPILGATVALTALRQRADTAPRQDTADQSAVLVPALDPRLP